MINRKIYIHNKQHTCYFDVIIKLQDFGLDNFLIDQKSYKNFLVYNISQKRLIDAKPMLIRFSKVNGFITVYDGTRYLVSFRAESMISFTLGFNI